MKAKAMFCFYSLYCVYNIYEIIERKRVCEYLCIDRGLDYIVCSTLKLLLRLRNMK